VFRAFPDIILGNSQYISKIIEILLNIERQQHSTIPSLKSFLTRAKKDDENFPLVIFDEVIDVADDSSIDIKQYQTQITYNTINIRILNCRESFEVYSKLW
jgi:hypothetical protein